jgi:hypothetical protein
MLSDKVDVIVFWRMKRRLRVATGRQYYVKPPFSKRGELGRFVVVTELD